MHTQDAHWMNTAIELAKRAESEGEVPVGAVIIYENQIIGQGWNQVISTHDPTAHAEVVALRDAGQRLENYRLLNTTLYVTLEPCVMCTGALIHARIQRVVFGTLDPKAGAMGGALEAVSLPHWNHRLDYSGGILAHTCGALLTDFFRRKRKG